ncbi:MAG: tetratricopeptide repeat protein, partial [Candidatus Obscuribacterales bacterium]
MQGHLNQFTVDRYLARTFVELALTSEKKLERAKLFNLALKSASVTKTLSYASSMGQKSDLALRVFVLFELKKQALAKQESMRLLDLFAQTKEEKSKVVYSAQALANLAQRFERAGDISSSRYLQLVAAKIPAVSEPVNTTDIKVESLYQMGLVAAHAGKLDEAQEKLKQALELQEKTMSDRLLRAFDSRLALAKTAVALDRREEAQEHFNLVIDRLKQIPKTERPQTAELLGQFLQMLEVDLSVVDWSVVDLTKISHSDKKSKLTTEQREKLLHGLNSLGVAAYLCKVDGDLVQAAHLFRRAYLINKYYFPELDVQLAATCYDLGETLYWDSHLEEAEHYMQEALRLREKNGRDCDDAINLRGTFGRILIIGGRGEGACRFYI